MHLNVEIESVSEPTAKKAEFVLHWSCTLSTKCAMENGIFYFSFRYLGPHLLMIKS